MSNARICLDCGLQLQGRVDKKFCDDQCRSNYNNRIYSESSAFVKEVNSILKRNRKILEELNPSGKTKVQRRKLIARGFDFSFITSIYQTQSGKTYYFCYEYGYLPLENEELLLVKREENII
jgi:hypothetical protein